MRRLALFALLLSAMIAPAAAQTEIEVHMSAPAVPVPPEREEEFVSAATFGQRYFAADDPQSALEELSKANAIAPNHPAILYNLAVVLMKTGRFAEAQERIDTYRALYPDGPESGQVRALQVDLNWGRDVQRRRQLNQAYVELFNRGKFVFERGNHEEALAIFRQAEQQRPEDAPAVFNQALALEAMGDFVGATERLRHYLSLQPDLSDKSAIDARLFELESEVAAERSSIVCGFCGARLPRGSAWCPHCWRGPYVESAQWNTRSCSTGATATRSTFFANGKLNSNEDLACLYEGSHSAALKYSRARQRAIRAEREKEGWKYSGETISSFRDRDSEVTLSHNGGYLSRAVSTATGDILRYQATPLEDGQWQLVSEERLVDGQKFLKRYSYDEKGRMVRETVTYHSANRCGHVVEVTGDYAYEGERLKRVDLRGGYEGYSNEGAPVSRWNATVSFSYDDQGLIQQEELVVQSHQKTYQSRIPPKLFDQLKSFYPNFRGKVAQDILQRGDVCAMVGSRWASDAIDLRAFDSWSPNLSLVLPLGVTRAVVSFTHPSHP